MKYIKKILYIKKGLKFTDMARALFSQVHLLMVQLVSKIAVKPRFEDMTLVAQRQVS